MSIKVKEIADDAKVSIQVNKGFYMMTKALSYYLFQEIRKTSESEEYFKDVMQKKYQDLDDLQRSFYTIALLLAEMETQFKNENLYIEKEVLQPGDEGYIAPKPD
jgi:hypothetical protein